MFSVLFDIAAKTASFESSMTRVERRIDGLASIAKKATVALGGVFSARYIADFVVNAIEAGDAINKAAIKAGVGVAAFSQLAYAAKQSDVDLQSLSTAFKKLEVAISKGDAVESFKAIGIQVAQLRALAPDKQFEAVAEAISRIKDPADRARAVVELLGRSGTDLLPMFERGAAGIRQLREEADQLGITLKESGAKAITAADEAMKRMKASAGALGQTIAVTTAPALAGFFDLLRRGLGGSTELERLQTQLADLQATKLTTSRYISNPEQFTVINKQIADTQAALNKLQFGTGTGTRGGAKRWQDSIIAQVMGTPEGFAEAKKTADKELDYFIVTAHQKQADYADQALSLTQTSVEKESEEWKNFYSALNWLRDHDLISQEEYFKRYNAQLDDTLSEFTVTAKALQEQFKNTNDEMLQIAEQAAQGIEYSLENFFFDPFHSGLKGLVIDFANTLRQMVARAAATDLMKALFGTGKSGSSSGGLADIFGSLLGGLFGGGSSGPYTGAAPATLGFATGGSFQVGGSGGIDSQLVRFRATPGEQVSITRPGDGGGNVTINPVYNIDARGATQELARALPGILRQNNESLKSDIISGIRRRKYPV